MFLNIQTICLTNAGDGLGFCRLYNPCDKLTVVSCKQIFDCKTAFDSHMLTIKASFRTMKIISFLKEKTHEKDFYVGCRCGGDYVCP